MSQVAVSHGSIAEMIRKRVEVTFVLGVPTGWMASSCSGMDLGLFLGIPRSCMVEHTGTKKMCIFWIAPPATKIQFGYFGDCNGQLQVAT